MPGGGSATSEGRGPPSLKDLAYKSLLHYKSHLTDIGYTPYELIQQVLEACTAEELMDIEDATKAGLAHRDLTSHTWPLWHKHCLGLPASLGGLPSRLPPLPKGLPAAEAAAGDDVKAANYRAVFEGLVERLKQRRALTGKKIRKAWDEEKRGKNKIQVRCLLLLEFTRKLVLQMMGLVSHLVQVIEPLDRRRGQVGSNGGHHGVAQPHQPTIKQRLMKKLHIRAPAAMPLKHVPLISAKKPPPRPLPTRTALIRPVAPTPKAKPKPKQYIQLEEDDIFV